MYLVLETFEFQEAVRRKTHLVEFSSRLRENIGFDWSKEDWIKISRCLILVD